MAIDIDEARRLGDAATKGPWIDCNTHIDDSVGLYLLRLTKRFEDMNCGDAHFITYARNHWTAIISELRVSRQMRESEESRWDAYEEAHKEVVDQLTRERDEAREAARRICHILDARLEERAIFKDTYKLLLKSYPWLAPGTGNMVGPQRVAPSSVAKIEAEAKQAKGNS